MECCYFGKKDLGQVQSSFIVECWDQYYSKPVADRLTEAQADQGVTFSFDRILLPNYKLPFPCGTVAAGFVVITPDEF